MKLFTDDDLWTWTPAARCAGRGTDDFFPEGPADHVARSEATAKALCRQCPVREECLATALALDERHGVWGGLTPAERAALRRPRVA